MPSPAVTCHLVTYYSARCGAPSQRARRVDLSGSSRAAVDVKKKAVVKSEPTVSLKKKQVVKLEPASSGHKRGVVVAELYRARRPHMCIASGPRAGAARARAVWRGR